MKNRVKGEIVIRRITPKDRNNTNCDLATFIKMGFEAIKYVAVVRGDNVILACGCSKYKIKQKLSSNITNKEFNKLARKTKWFYQQQLKGEK